MEGSCKLGAVMTALVEGSWAATDALGTGSSLSKRDTAETKIKQSKIGVLCTQDALTTNIAGFKLPAKTCTCAQ